MANDKFLILENLQRFFDKYKTHTHTAQQISGLPASLPANGGNADTVDGIHIAENGKQGIPFLYTDYGPFEIGQYLDFHTADNQDFRGRIMCGDDGLFYPLKNTSDGLQYAQWGGTCDNANTLAGLHVNEIAGNPNLLINPDFRINQRGQTEYTFTNYDDKYTLDRWLLSPKWFIGENNGIIVSNLGFTKTEAEVRGSIEQLLSDEIINLINGKTCTLSAGASNGEIISKTFVCDMNRGDYDQREIVNGTDNKWNAEFYHWNGYRGGRPCVRITVSDPSITVSRVKLELGSLATPFVSPDTVIELLKCQRYYQIRSTGSIPAVDLCPIMAKTPTVTQLSNGNYAYDAEIQ